MPKKNFINDATAEPFISARFYDKFEGGGIPYTGDTFDEDTGSATGLDEDKWDPFGTQGITPTWQPNYCRMQTNNDGAGAYGTTYLDSEYNFTGDFEFSFLMRHSSGQTTQHSLFLYAYDGGGNSGMYIQLSDVNNMYVETLNGGWVNQGALSGTAGSMFSLDTTVTMKRVGRDLTITVSNTSGTSTKTVVDAISVGEATVPWKIRVSLSNWFTQDAGYRESFYRVDDYSIISGGTDLPTSSETPTENWWFDKVQEQTGEILNNALHFADSIQSGYLNSNFSVSGDFDIQVDYDCFSAPSVHRWAHFLRCHIGSDIIGVSRGYTTPESHHYDFQTKISGAWGNTYSATAETSGKFRMTRVADTFTGYRWDGTSWDLLDSYVYDGTETADPNFALEKFTETASSGIDFSNFIINSAEKIIWPGGALKAWVPQDGTTFLEEFNNYQSHWNGQPGYPRNSYWNQWGDTTSTILNDKLRVVQVASTVSAGINSKFHLSGEFTVEADFDVIAQAGGSLFTCGIAIENLGYTDGFYAGYYNTAGNPHTWCTSNLYSTVYTPIGSNDSTSIGKVRMVRDAANLITATGWDGTAWVPIGSQTLAGTVEAGVYIVAQSGFGTGTVDFDNVSVVADSITWNDAGNWTPSRMNHFGDVEAQQTEGGNRVADGTIGLFPDNYYDFSTADASAVIAPDGVSITYELVAPSSSRYAHTQHKTWGIPNDESWSVIYKLDLAVHNNYVGYFFWIDIRNASPSLARVMCFWKPGADKFQIDLDPTSGGTIFDYANYTTSADIDDLYVGISFDGGAGSGEFTINLAETETDGQPDWIPEATLNVPVADFAPTNTADWTIIERLQSGPIAATFTVTSTYLDGTLLSSGWKDEILKTNLVSDVVPVDMPVNDATTGWVEFVDTTAFSSVNDSTVLAVYTDGDSQQQAYWNTNDLDQFQGANWTLEIDAKILVGNLGVDNYSGGVFRLVDTSTSEYIEFGRLTLQAPGGSYLRQLSDPFTNPGVLATDSTDLATHYVVQRIDNAFHVWATTGGVEKKIIDDWSLPDNAEVQPRLYWRVANDTPDHQLEWSDLLFTGYSFKYTGNTQ